MKVYLPHDGTRPPSPSHLMTVAPAAHLAQIDGETDVPLEWVTADNKPLTFTVEFHHGEADVADNLGRYLLKAKLARKTRLVTPATVD